MPDYFPVLIEPEELEQRLSDPGILVVDLCADQQYQKAHLPNAVHISPSELVGGQQPATGKLPSKERLDELFSRIGLTADKQVVAYDDEGGGWAGRLIWTLDVIGHRHSAYLNGGFLAWQAEGLATTAEIPQVEPTRVDCVIDAGPIVEAEDIMANLGSPDMVVWDARTPEEFRGEKQTAQRCGHIPGAISCNWTDLMDPQRNYRIRLDAEEYLAKLGLSPDKDIITHCQTHHRSGFTYLVARLLKYPEIRAYHGSWGEWGNRPDTPVEC